MATVTIQEAQARLADLIENLASGEEILITRDAQPVAKLIRQMPERPQPVFGRGKGKVIIVAEDEEHLRGFEDYTP